jgi:hypothetical protein
MEKEILGYGKDGQPNAWAFHETVEERQARQKRAFDEAVANLNLTPGMVATLAGVQMKHQGIRGYKIWWLERRIKQQDRYILWLQEQLAELRTSSARESK